MGCLRLRGQATAMDVGRLGEIWLEGELLQPEKWMIMIKLY